jgi:uncharacterized membrane protein
VKTVAWRVIASSLGLIYFYAVTRDVTKTFEAVGITTVISMIAYYLHERAWNAISWGREQV